MTTDPFTRQLDFLNTIDALKGIDRASPIIDRSRRENSAEHSWHIAMYALVLEDHAPEGVDIGRVVRMLLIHDIVEIDAGDLPIHGAHDFARQAELERAAAERIFGLLPPEQAATFHALWHEFEAAETLDARFAKSLDRLQPMMQNIATGGGTWTTYAVDERQILDRCGPSISGGSPSLWQKTRDLVQKFFQTA
ncbi:HD family hydrolase [Acuticoccus sp. I52.16.1]|uniref:HD domain-containing protein n=1 Tax=Acuticoccus sp. I52.16.1 TaxID=2928472 RepID=UPI001FD1CEB6|nr:HD domain-containing protein [Acuticoccus sp. I52.16.1]UOM33322.1 HD domain-containing protein [Acuticoccus sp. I52.16.1]